jgi:hypothetical protein
MKFNEVVGDFTKFEVLPNTMHFMPHGLNSWGIFGSGAVMAIHEKYPKATEAYTSWFDGLCDQHFPKCLDKYNRIFELGNIQVVNVAPQKFVVNMLTQKGMGSHYNMPPGRYEAIEECLRKLEVCCQKVLECGKEVSIEACKFGSARSGLSWETIFKMVEDIFEHTEGTWNTYTYEGPHA